MRAANFGVRVMNRSSTWPFSRWIAPVRDLPRAVRIGWDALVIHAVGVAVGVDPLDQRDRVSVQSRAVRPCPGRVSDRAPVVRTGCSWAVSSSWCW